MVALRSVRSGYSPALIQYIPEPTVGELLAKASLNPDKPEVLGKHLLSMLFSEPTVAEAWIPRQRQIECYRLNEAARIDTGEKIFFRDLPKLQGELRWACVVEPDTVLIGEQTNAVLHHRTKGRLEEIGGPFHSLSSIRYHPDKPWLMFDGGKSIVVIHDPRKKTSVSQNLGWDNSSPNRVSNWLPGQLFPDEYLRMQTRPRGIYAPTGCDCCFPISASCSAFNCLLPRHSG